MKKMDRTTRLPVVFALLLCLSIGVNAVQSAKVQRLETRLSMERQRELTDVARAMADIEINLQKLLIAAVAVEDGGLGQQGAEFFTAFIIAFNNFNRDACTQ